MIQPNENNKLSGSGEIQAIYSGKTPFPITDCELSAIPLKIKVEHILYSHPSRLIFGLNENTGEKLVLKFLVEELDPRYNLSTISKRQYAQWNALKRNKWITPNVYLGLASLPHRVLNCLDQGETIELGPLDRDPELEHLDETLEYAVVMRRLPEDLQLKILLSFLKDDVQIWGSCEQLQKKLMDNIRFSDQKLAKVPAYQEIVESLKELSINVFDNLSYRKHFERRRYEGYIKCCHGDLKTQNIWIVPPDDPFDKKRWLDVKILDAIDFNPVYSNIDILSDFAMLVVDVRVQTDARLADEMIKKYLELTQQENEEVKFVLNYYLVEKALVSATLRSVKEDLPEPDLAFLAVAREYLYKLRQYTRQFKRIEVPVYSTSVN